MTPIFIKFSEVTDECETNISKSQKEGEPDSPSGSIEGYEPSPQRL